MPSEREMHKFDEMTEPELAKYLNGLAGLIKDCTPTSTGFVLLLAPMDARVGNAAQYVGNVEREDAIKWMRETADRLEAGDAVDRGPLG